MRQSSTSITTSIKFTMNSMMKNEAALPATRALSPHDRHRHLGFCGLARCKITQRGRQRVAHVPYIAPFCPTHHRPLHGERGPTQPANSTQPAESAPPRTDRVARFHRRRSGSPGTPSPHQLTPAAVGVPETRRLLDFRGVRALIRCVQRLPTSARVLTMLWVNRTHIATSPWPHSQPFTPARFNASSRERRCIAAAGDGTERMSHVPGTLSPSPQPRGSAR
jgi:hypothetical protein